ncbi:MAG: pseudoazurin [Pseudomonadota bacterium]
MRTAASILIALLAFSTTAVAENHRVLMLNAATDATGQPNVFEPAIVYAQPGDTVTFVPVDPGHNAASKRGMIPEGAAPWNGGIDEELAVELTVPGIYGYICLPHYEMGMVGLIVVGDDRSNLKRSRKIRHPGSARKIFRKLLKSVEN